MNRLTELHVDIDARVQSIRGDHADWLCSKGCDSCCKRLAEVPQLTGAEWTLLRQGLASLPPEDFKKISQAIATLARSPSRPVVCPLLDRATGACQVYLHRPVACRTYGFYMQRDLGLFCREIESLVAEDALPNVVWGNHDAVDRRLAGLGESRVLTEWFADWQQESQST
jgi:Fe-S-cluster containining protein